MNPEDMAVIMDSWTVPTDPEDPTAPPSTGAYPGEFIPKDPDNPQLPFASSGTTPEPSSGPFRIKIEGPVEPTALVLGDEAGYVSAPPYWDAVKIEQAWEDELLVETQAGSPTTYPVVVEMLVTEEGQTEFELPGAPLIGEPIVAIRGPNPEDLDNQPVPESPDPVVFEFDPEGSFWAPHIGRLQILAVDTEENPDHVVLQVGETVTFKYYRGRVGQMTQVNSPVVNLGVQYAEILAVHRIRDDTQFNVDQDHPGYVPEAGFFSVFDQLPQIRAGDDIRFQYTSYETLKVEVIEADYDNQVQFVLGSYPVRSVEKVTNVDRDDTEYELDEESGLHDLESGRVALKVPPDPYLVGDTFRVAYRGLHFGSIPAGVDYALIPIPPGPAPGQTEPIAKGDAWADAYTTLIAGGQAGGLSAADLEPAKAAMAQVIEGMMTPIPPLGLPPLGPISIQAGAQAFWATLVTEAATQFTGAVTVVPPPGLQAMTAAMMAVAPVVLALGPFPGTPWTEAIPKTANRILAAVIHQTTLGGFVVIQAGPVPVPVPFV